MIAARLTAARERLADALRHGQDTTWLRRAVVQLETDAEAASQLSEQKVAAQAADARHAIERRAAAMIADIHFNASQTNQEKHK